MLARPMDCTWLGHAMWLVEAGPLRLLTNPLLAPTHHGGVFELVPPRTVDVEALAPTDFVLVSHRHPNHFDVPSLAQLARLDADSVVVTPNPLVAWAARELGFRTVRTVAPGKLIELDGVRLVTTPSLSADEWGTMFATDDAVVWNQVDTVFSDVASLRAALAASLAALGATRIDLALARWQPMLEIAAPLGHRTAFPYRDYAQLLDQAAAIGARALVPASCSGTHAGPFAWMDRYVFPVGQARFARDLERRAHGLAVLPPLVGARYRVRHGDISVLPDQPIVRVLDAPDPARSTARSRSRRSQIRAWRSQACARAWPPGSPRSWHRRWRPRGPTWASRQRCDSPSTWCSPAAATATRSWSTAPVRASIAASIPTGTRATSWPARCSGRCEGRRHWGDLLLGGALRAVTGLYEVNARGLHPAELSAAFLYYALPYDEAVRRAVRWQVVQATEGRTLRVSRRY